MSTSHRVWLRDNATGSHLEATLYERIDESYAHRVDDMWLSYLEAEQGGAEVRGRPLPRLDHNHWRWRAKVAQSAQLLSCPTLAVESGGVPQGLMLLMTDGHFARLPAQIGKPLVYVTYLASAPWNLPVVTNKPRHSGVGAVLLLAAIATSEELEFKGRIGLHSLPMAEGFYERLGFACLGPDTDKEGMKYYELSPEAAAEFVKGENHET